MTIDDKARSEMKKLIANWPALAKISEDALYVFHMIGHGEKMLLYTPINCLLSNRDGSKAESIKREWADELRGAGLISPLSQYGHGSKVGWRELIGSIGEHFDVYLCTQ